MPTSYVGGQNYHFTLLLRAPLSLGAAVRWASPTGYGSAPYISFVTPALRLSRIMAPIFYFRTRFWSPDIASYRNLYEDR